MVWGMEGFDRAPTRTSDDRDLISFDRKSVNSSLDGQRYSEAAPVSLQRHISPVVAA